MDRLKILYIGVMAVLLGGCGNASVDAGTLSRHIRETMGSTVREMPVDTLGNLALPYPYSVPCVRGGFQNMFYWDTYFTNLGLLVDGDTVQARNNIADIAAMVERVGYMPNASHIDLLNRSQPPYLALMLDDYFKVTDDTAFVERMLPAVVREHDFWMTCRSTPVGLNRYGHAATDEELLRFYRDIGSRVGYDPDGTADEVERIAKGAHLLAEAESGWDFNRRFDRRCLDYCPVDLNALMYATERIVARYTTMLSLQDADEWDSRAERRRELMECYLVDPATGVMLDYDYVNGKRSDVLSAASMWPMLVGVANEVCARATREAFLSGLEAPHGVYTCELSGASGLYQWDAPNCWSACVFAAYEGLHRYGYDEDARRVARKYVDSIVAIYNATGQMWEKYNAQEGNVNVQDEYPMPGEFMGWTAGVFQHAYNFIND